MWRLRESAHAALTDAGGAILDERTGRWTTPATPTATAAVLLLLSCDTQQQAAQRYADRYGLTTEHAAAGVRTVADALTAQGLTVTTDARGCPLLEVVAVTSMEAYSTVRTRHCPLSGARLPSASRWPWCCCGCRSGTRSAPYGGLGVSAGAP